MTRAGVAALKARLSEFLARVRAGEEVIVTDRGRPVARLVPLASGGAGPDELADLVRAGIIAPAPRAADAAFWREFRRLPGPRGGKRVLAALLEERREGD